MAEPVTASEEYLSLLCAKAFLHLWSYPNLYKDQGKRGAGDGKELCDLTVVFGDDIFLFSDKHCFLNGGSGLEQSWSRWYRRAVLKSASQVCSAERWFRTQSQRIFLDRRCNEPLPISLPATPTFHRILTVRGAADAAKGIWGGAGSLITSNADLAGCEHTPLRLGALDDEGRMFHVFDEVALECVLTTLDTVTDFRDYLVRRERLFRARRSVLVASEEDLLGFYLFSDTQDEDRGHDFVIAPDVTDVVIDSDYWSGWTNSAQKTAKEKADRVSYCWDRLIEKFSLNMLNGTQHFPSKGGVREEEKIVRWMAKERRMHRRMLSESLLEVMATVPVGGMRRRYFPPPAPTDPWWTFLAFPRPPSLEYDKYREARSDYLRWQCLIVKHMNPAALDVIGIAVDPQEGELSEDALYLNARVWNEEIDNYARSIQETTGIFKSGTRVEKRHWEYPINGNTPTEGGDV